jgi:tRNA(Arg) A34 adenosine deaminase TadA
MDRRDVLGGGLTLITATLAGASGSRARLAAVLPDDARFMELAIAEAAQAAFPFGAVIVKNNEVIARGHNRTGVDRDPTAHGEIVAIRSCLAAHGPDVLKGATLYTSGEPCCMCMGAIIWCGIGRLAYAASIAQLSTKIGQIMLTSEDVAAKTPFATIDIAGGVLDDKAMALFK